MAGCEGNLRDHSEIMLLDSLTPINKAFSVVVQQERQMSATGVIESSFDTKIFAVNTDQCTGSGRGLAVNSNQYPRYGRGRGNAGRGRGRGRSTTG